VLLRPRFFSVFWCPELFPRRVRQGGAGAKDLALAVVAACDAHRSGGGAFKFLYPLTISAMDKIATVRNAQHTRTKVHSKTLHESALQDTKVRPRTHREKCALNKYRMLLFFQMN
jgi:formyltetrahydrofolate synthetase